MRWEIIAFNKLYIIIIGQVLCTCNNNGYNHYREDSSVYTCIYIIIWVVVGSDNEIHVCNTTQCKWAAAVQSPMSMWE